jgi:Ser/Thr protein kinase RdoA (MazF antagonist)
MTTNTTPNFTLNDAVTLAREHYGLSAEASVLPSERDQNFTLTGDLVAEGRAAAGADTGRKYVLKIAKSDEPCEVLELQNAALSHLAWSGPHLALPRLVPTSAGAELVTIQSPSGRSHFMPSSDLARR